MNDLKLQSPHLTGEHLTHEQLSNLVIADPTICDLDLPQVKSDADLERHLHECAACSSELAALRLAVAGFREAATAQAASQMQRRVCFSPRASDSQPSYRFLALWAASAAALVVAISAQFHLHPRQPAAAPIAISQNRIEVSQPTPQHTQESDEALLTSIDQDLSASIPSSMQPLADPLPSDSTASTSK